MRNLSGDFGHAKVRQRVSIGGNWGQMYPLRCIRPPSPRERLWWRTFYHLQRAVEGAEDHAADDFIVAARRLLKMG
jgi:hypothetical protein